MVYNTVEGHFGSPSGKKKPSNTDRKNFGKQIEKSLSPNGRNNGSQTHEIKKKKKALEEVNGLKGARKERKSKSWAIYDVEKREWATADPK